MIHASTKRVFLLSLSLLVGGASVALATPQTADEWYQEGSNQYAIREFDKAIDAFKKGYELEKTDGKKAAYLFNIAQVYKQRGGPGDCTNAQFYFRRFLDLKSKDTAKPLKADLKKDVEDKIAELEECVQKEKAAGTTGGNTTKTDPNTTKTDPNATKTDPNATKTDPNATKTDPKVGGNTTDPKTKTVGDNTNTDDDNNNDDDDTHHHHIHKHANTDQPKTVSVRMLLGAGKVNTGQIDNSVQPMAEIIGGYPIAVTDQITVEAGAALGFTGLPYDHMGGKQTATVTRALANVGLTYAVTNEIGVRLDVGVGALLLGNVSESPYTGGMPTTGALGMLDIRGQLAGEYAVTPNIIVTAAPGFGFSPAKSGLRDDIKSITYYDFMVGVGYRM